MTCRSHFIVSIMGTDKLNRVDYRWFVVRTQPRQEKMLAGLLAKRQETTKNILEVYCPTHAAITMRRGGKEESAPLFTGFVFVLATRQAISEFMEQSFPDGVMLYDYSKKVRGRKAGLLTIPEEQMRTFMDFNENYADKVVVLERPFADYAFNPNENNEPNEIVRVLDGPLAGCEGYVCRFRRKRGLVFQVQGVEPGSHLTVSYPNVYDLHVVRLHNAEGDRLSVGTEKGRAVDLLIGILQACGYGGRALPKLYDIMERLSVKLSLVSLCRELREQGEKDLSLRLSRMTDKEAALLLNLARYERDCPGYVRRACPKLILRPFLTPTPGVEIEEGKNETELRHKDFTEIIRRVDITEEVYYPSSQKGGTVTTPYYAHVGLIEDKEEKCCTVFANWDGFLHEYFLTAGKANEKLVSGTVKVLGGQGADNENKEKLIESFRNYAPTLYRILTDKGSPVKVVPDFKVGDDTLAVIAVKAAPAEKDTAKAKLVRACVCICKEINTTNHLAVWRRYLRTVWLHE